MSIHKSLKIASGMAHARNVYTRFERLQKLMDGGRWSDGDPVYGLPKVRATVVKVGKKKKKKGPKDEEA